MLLSTSLCAVTTNSQAADKPADGPGVHVVLFTPEGVTPPADATQTIAAAAEYTETFLVEGMKQWGYPPAREQIFDRDTNGKIRVLTVQGSKSAKEYNESQPLLREMWPLAHKEYALPRRLPVWWVWVYKGDPPIRFGNYRGSGNVRQGGWSVVNYTNLPGNIALDKDMAAGFHHEFTLKGCAHELGHAFGLFHLGPKVSDKSGNTLMGPTTIPYRKRLAENPRANTALADKAYLSEASAAILWKHWAFTGTVVNRNTLPTVAVTDYQARHDVRSGEIVVTGKLTSNGVAHSVILVDEAPPRQTDYWQKTYVARIGKEGRFAIRIREPTQAAGTLRLLFCFDNGALTGDGKTRTLKTAFAKRYTAVGRTYRFEQ